MRKLRQETDITDEVITARIFTIRGKKVMLDRDLAELYGVKPIRLREQVKRNPDRFPEKFMLQLTAAEVDSMVSQNAIPSKKQLGGHMPYVFTEHGVMMLSNILKSERAIRVSIRIIEVFVQMREIVLNSKNILAQVEKLERKVGKQDKDIRLIFTYLKQLLEAPSSPRRKIGFLRDEE